MLRLLRLCLLQSQYAVAGHFCTKINVVIRSFSFVLKKGGKRTLMAGRKSKYSSENSNTKGTKIWSVAVYIRLSQEDAGIRRRQARK